jgi:soluble lytic murein transglycosylase-like protein
MYTESRFRSHVLSPVGARGVLQIMPWTGQQLAAGLGELGDRFDADTLFDPGTNIHYSAYYVAELLKKFHGQPAFAYGSYNGGPSNVSRWLAAKSSARPLELDVYIEEIPFSETQRYTRRVLETQAIYSLLYRGELPRWTNAVDPAFENNIDF